MRIDLPVVGEWNKVSEKFREKLPFQDPLVLVQAYMGYQHALHESTLGVARLFSHKKTIAIVENAEPALQEIAVGFSEEGYTVKTLKAADLANGAEWLAPIQNELLLVLFSQDDPITGRRYDGSPIDQLLKDKRIFRVSVSHTVHEFEPIKRPELFEIRILSLTPGFSLLVAGERYRVPPVIAPRLPWAHVDLTEPLSKVGSIRDSEKHKQAVLNFESALPQGFTPFFAQGDLRIFDRAVIVNEGMDGSAVIEHLGPIANYPAAALDTSSPCRWNNTKYIDWLISRGEKPETVRGLVVIAAEALTEKTPEQLAAAAVKITQLQEGI